MDNTTTPNLRMLLLLEAIGNSTKALTIAELATILELPKPTTHRLVKTLLREGFLEKHGLQLAIAKRTAILASNLSLKHPSNVARHHILQSLARASKETVNFVIPTEKGMTYSDRVETDWHFRVMLPIGTYVPFYCTASGKTFLASLRKQPLEKLIENITFDRHTSHTITDKQTLLAEIKKVRKQGYAIDDEEFYHDMLAIAVPVYDQTGHYVGALAIHGPKSRFSQEKALRMLGALKQAGDDLGDVLFER